MSRQRTRVALYSGLIVEGDAISGSLRRKLDVLRRAGERFDVDPVAFCQYSDVDDPAIRVVGSSVLDLVRHRDFGAAALHIFEFGICYDLFNVALLLPRERMAAIYHNITPPELVDDPVVRMAIDRSMAQKHLLDRMAHVGCDSEFNRRDLIDFGIADERLSVVPLPASIEPAQGPERGKLDADEPIRFLFVGRFVRAKGLADLIEAARRLVGLGCGDFRLRLVGRKDASDPLTLGHLESALDDPILGPRLQYSPNISTEELSKAYTECDALIIPSYHEGFCVPVVEAFAAGCQVVAYDNSNLPTVTAGLGRLVRTGDVKQLALEMQRLAERLREARLSGDTHMVATTSGEYPEREWQRKAASLAVKLPAQHDERFLDLVSSVLSSRGRVQASS